MSDEYLIEMIRSGRLRVDLQTQRVWYYHRSHRCWKEKKADFHPLSGRARFRFDFPKVKRSTVYRNRLIFIAKEMREVDRVDHKDGDPLNDHPDNLQEHSTSKSCLQGRTVQQRRVVQNAIDFFDYLAFFGYEPPVGSQIDTGKGYR